MMIFEVSESDERLPDGEGEDVEELREFPARGKLDAALTANTDPRFPMFVGALSGLRSSPFARLAPPRSKATRRPREPS